MATKNNRPQVENPLANMGLDDIVRGITSPQVATETEEAEEASEIDPESETEELSINQGKEQRKRRTKAEKLFQANFDKYARVGEQGTAIWLPKEVKKKLELICAQSDKNIPIRSLAAAIIMTYIEENGEIMANL